MTLGEGRGGRWAGGALPEPLLGRPVTGVLPGGDRAAQTRLLRWLSSEPPLGGSITCLFSSEPSLPSSEVADEPPTLTKEEPVPLETQVREGGLKPCLNLEKPCKCQPGMTPVSTSGSSADRIVLFL